MSSVRCDCQHVIRDTTDNLPFKARFLPDQNDIPFMETITKDLAELVDLASKGRREEWIAKHFLKGYPLDIPDVSVISDYLSGQISAHFGLAYQCDECGRLLIYRDTKSHARVFVPNGEWKGTFEKITSGKG